MQRTHDGPAPDEMKGSHLSAASPAAWDRIGMGLSGLCVVHCLLLPVVLGVLPLWSLAEEVHGWLHLVFALLLVPLTLLAAATGYRQHRERPVLLLLGLGLVVVLSGSVLGHEVPGALTETVLTVSGSVLLIAGHWRNWRACSRCAVHRHP